MAKGYWVAAYHTISDRDKLVAYGKLAVPAIEAAGGRLLARGGQVTGREDGIGFAERTTIWEFDSYEHALKAYDTEAYRRALDVLEGAVVRDFRIVEGLD
jgi:uncharacterized protein (DUF1330 family)